MIKIIIIMLIAGVGLSVYGCNELKLAHHAKPSPSQITCAKLQADGYGDNANVEVTALMVANNYVYQKEKEGSTFNTVWVPVVPNDGAYMKMIDALPEGAKIPPPTDVHMIVKTNRVHSETDFNKFQEKTTITGLIINDIESVSGDEKRLLQQTYPGVDFDKCMILEEAREPMGTGQCLGLLGGGIALLAVGGVLGLNRMRR